MRKIILFVSLGLLFMSASPPPATRITKEFSSIGELTKALMNFEVLNFPSIKVVEETDGLRSMFSVMEKPFVDVIVTDDYYGTMFMQDGLLRYLVMACDEHHVDLFLALAIIQHDNLNQPNPSLSTNEQEARRSVYDRLKWIQKVELLGVKPQNIFMGYKELPKGFF